MVEETLAQLAEDPFHPILKTHKLSGEFAGIWACLIDYSYRILFEFVANPQGKEDAILLLNLGDHDKVY